MKFVPFVELLDEYFIHDRREGHRRVQPGWGRGATLRYHELPAAREWDVLVRENRLLEQSHLGFHRRSQTAERQREILVCLLKTVCCGVLQGTFD